MTFEEKRIVVNHKIQKLLIVTSDSPVSFGTTIKNERDNEVDIYYVPYLYRSFEENGQYIYWFLPTSKETLYANPPEELESQLADAQEALEILGYNSASEVGA